MKDAYYFSHDSNAKDDPKCVLLIEQLGLEGYGIFWVLIETLRDQPEYKYPLVLLPALARRYNTTAQKMEAVVKGYGLFQFTDNEFFFSHSLINRMKKLEEKRELQRQKALKRWKKDTTEVPQLCHGITEAMPLKESKVKKSKANEIFNKTALQCAIDDFREFRKKIKKPMTDRAVELLTENLNKLAPDDETKIKILNQSIVNGWQGVFELKQKDGEQRYESKSNIKEFASFDKSKFLAK